MSSPDVTDPTAARAAALEAYIAAAPRPKLSPLARGGAGALGLALFAGGGEMAALVITLGIRGYGLGELGFLALASVGMMGVGVRVMRYAWSGTRRFLFDSDDD